MSYGHLDRKQAKALRALVQGRRVHDLGCGDQTLTRDLVKFGASEVTAVDCDPVTFRVRLVKIGERWLPQRVVNNSITTIKATFEEYAKEQPEIDIAFLSWPMNRVVRGLLPLVESARMVVYLGTCLGGTYCGFPSLFKHFLGRELLVHVPHKKNTLFIYGGALDTPREGEEEERAGIDSNNIWPYLGIGISAMELIPTPSSELKERLPALG